MPETETPDKAGKLKFDLAPATIAKLSRVFDNFPGIDAVWMYGSRARGTQRHESDIDLAVDAEGLDASQFVRLKGQIEDLELIYRLDVVHLQGVISEDFRGRIMRDRKIFWQPRLLQSL